MKRMLIVACLCLGLPACALTVDKIDVPYQGAANLSVVPGAETAKFTLRSADARTVYRDRVSVKKNGYGMEMAAIQATNDIPDTVGRAITQELQSLGFAMGTGGSTVEVEVARFYSDFKMGFFAGDAVAEVALNVNVTGPDGRVSYSKHYEAGGVEPNIQMALGHNARAALIVALRNAVAAVINDTALQNALLQGRTLIPTPTS
jgi:uncharacterized lipoprotein YajG